MNEALQHFVFCALPIRKLLPFRHGTEAALPVQKLQDGQFFRFQGWHEMACIIASFSDRRPLPECRN